MQPLSKNKLKYVRSLHLSKYRQKYNNFLVEGHKSVHEFLKWRKYDVEAILATEQWLDVVDKVLLKGLEDKIHTGSNQDIAQCGMFSSGGDVVVILAQERAGVGEILKLNKPAFFLDDVQDPGNVGTIIRIADWFGFAGVIRSEASADFFNPKVVQASMGSMNNILLANGTVDDLPPEKMVVLDMAGSAVNDWVPQQDSIVVLGNEGNGVRQAVLEKAKTCIAVPGVRNRLAESLNVAITAGIIASKFMD